MALPATAVWEVRPTAGSDTACGGGFDPAVASPGTDYSQQNAAQYTFTDLASISSLVVASVSHNFVAADVGNFMQITAGTGFTAGFYEIVSVAANQATLDRSPGTVGVGGTYFVGGALATVAQAIAEMVPGNVVYIQNSGSYIVTATQTGIPSNCQFIGYGSSRGDGTQVTWTTSTNSVNLVTLHNNQIEFANIHFECTAGTPGALLTVRPSGGNVGQITVTNCLFDGGTYGVWADYTTPYTIQGLICQFCEFKNQTINGIANCGAISMFACFIHDTTAEGVNIGNAGFLGAVASFERCVFKGCGGLGGLFFAHNADTPSIVNCAFYANTNSGVYLSNVNSLQVINSIFWGQGAPAIRSNGSAAGQFFSNNAFGSNTGGNYNGCGPGVDDVTLTGDPFTNASSGDFSLNNTSGAGAACKQAGVPTVIP